MSIPKEALQELAVACAEAMSQGIAPEEIYRQMVQRGIPQDTAALVVETVAQKLASLSQDDVQPSFWGQLSERGRQLLDSGHTTVDLFHLAMEQCPLFYDSDPVEALAMARLATEAIASVHAANVREPLDYTGFFGEVMAQVLRIQEGPPEGPTIRLYPLTLPRQFFFDPARFLDMCVRMGARCLDILWQTTPGCPGLLATGAAHNGKLKDGRRYLVLRLPPPQVRFEGHFVAFVGGSGEAPPRMFAIERGVSPEESVLCECYADGGRLRLGAAGPAESKNFIRLVRQQLGL